VQLQEMLRDQAERDRLQELPSWHEITSTKIKLSMMTGARGARLSPNNLWHRRPSLLLIEAVPPEYPMHQCRPRKISMAKAWLKIERRAVIFSE
jgi:hypothetical protein